MKARTHLVPTSQFIIITCIELVNQRIDQVPQDMFIRIYARENSRLWFRNARRVNYISSSLRKKIPKKRLAGEYTNHSRLCWISHINHKHRGIPAADYKCSLPRTIVLDSFPAEQGVPHLAYHPWGAHRDVEQITNRDTVQLCTGVLWYRQQ